jgi:hypothetical protein
MNERTCWHPKPAGNGKSQPPRNQPQHPRVNLERQCFEGCTTNQEVSKEATRTRKATAPKEINSNEENSNGATSKKGEPRMPKNVRLFSVPSYIQVRACCKDALSDVTSVGVPPKGLRFLTTSKTLPLPSPPKHASKSRCSSGIHAPMETDEPGDWTTKSAQTSMMCSKRLDVWVNAGSKCRNLMALASPPLCH